MCIVKNEYNIILKNDIFYQHNEKWQLLYEGKTMRGRNWWKYLSIYFFHSPFPISLFFSSCRLMYYSMHHWTISSCKMCLQESHTKVNVGIKSKTLICFQNSWELFMLFQLMFQLLNFVPLFPSSCMELYAWTYVTNERDQCILYMMLCEFMDNKNDKNAYRLRNRRCPFCPDLNVSWWYACQVYASHGQTVNHWSDLPSPRGQCCGLLSPPSAHKQATDGRFTKIFRNSNFWFFNYC